MSEKILKSSLELSPVYKGDIASLLWSNLEIYKDKEAIVSVL